MQFPIYIYTPIYFMQMGQFCITIFHLFIVLMIPRSVLASFVSPDPWKATARLLSTVWVISHCKRTTSCPKPWANVAKHGLFPVFCILFSSTTTYPDMRHDAGHQFPPNSHSHLFFFILTSKKTPNQQKNLRKDHPDPTTSWKCTIASPKYV